MQNTHIAFNPQEAHVLEFALLTTEDRRKLSDVAITYEASPCESVEAWHLPGSKTGTAPGKSAGANWVEAMYSLFPRNHPGRKPCSPCATRMMDAKEILPPPYLAPNPADRILWL